MGGQDADGGTQEARLRLLAAFQGHSPLVRGVIPVRGRDCAASACPDGGRNLSATWFRYSSVSGWGRSAFLPIPFLHQLLRK